VRIKLDLGQMRQIALFEKITHIQPRDCFEDELTKQLCFIVPPDTISRAIGKSGANAKKLESLFKKKIRIVEYSEELCEFIQNLLYPLKLTNAEITAEGGVLLEAKDHATRGYIIGRAAQNLRNLEKNVRRFFEVKEIKVV